MAKVGRSPVNYVRDVYGVVGSWFQSGPNPGCWGHLDNEPMDRRSLPTSVVLSNKESIFKNKKLFLKPTKAYIA